MWKASTIPSAFTRSMAVLRAQNAPVRPIPALRVCVCVCVCERYINHYTDMYRNSHQLQLKCYLELYPTHPTHHMMQIHTHTHTRH